MDARLRAAVAGSHLRDLPPGVLEKLLDGAGRASVPRGSVTHWEGDHTPHLELVVTGVIRVFVTAPDGRTMTIRYCRPGALLGAMSLFAAGFAMPASTQALLDVELLRISPAMARDMVGDPPVAHMLLRELSERARSFVHEIPGGAFATVRQRVARHLLDLASERVRRGAAEDSSDRDLVVPVSQQELAEAVGTVREVVVRVLRELREDGLVRTERGRIILLDPVRLIREEWNPGS